ncbi:MAG TPA: PAS domain-containing protein, partial [Silvibacterium sp.]|nr:PAS domain-containing protein [Silvibacterium sp.]
MPKSQFNFLQNAPSPLRWAMGLITALAAFGIVLLLPPNHRAPYLVAYPGVVLSAWFFGVGAGIVCAVASGAIIEYLVFYSHTVPIRPVLNESGYRLVTFVVASVAVTWLSQQVSRLREHNATEELRRELELAAVEQRLSEERERAQTALHERETRLQMALRGGQIGLWDLDLASGSLLWSDEHFRILGLEPGSVPPSYELLQNAIHPEDRAAMEALYQNTLAEGRSLYCEYRVVRPDGTLAWVEAEGQYELNAAGKPVR